MKDSFLTILKIILISLLVLLFILLLIVGARYLMGWSWGVVGFLLLGLLGIAVGALFLRKLLLRRREQRFVQQVIAQDEAQLQSLAGKEKETFRELQDRWREAVETLQRSHLRKQGNPLYVLPWYLVIGESGSGKTTAIESARLSSPFADFRKTSGLAGTRNCDWWFFEQAVILDTAGRYAVPVDEGRDKEEWQKFLNLLVKYRKKEPLNGLIVTIAADKLLADSAESLNEEGLTIRRRIDELMRVLGARIPVYVLVTKCDLIRGMSPFSDQLPANSLDQAMGVLKKDFTASPAAFLDQVFEAIGERLRHFRILLFQQPLSKTSDPAIFLFPEEFGQLQQGLGCFMEAAFRENPYQETPILRGLYFSSGRQEGTPYSHFLKNLGLIGEKEVLPGTDKGLFLHDFFGKILPRERGLLTPTKRVMEWRTITRNLGLVAWIVLGIALSGLLFFSFLNNLEILKGIPSRFAQSGPLSGERMASLEGLREFRDAILEVEEKNRAWKLPRFGLDASLRAERTLKDRYCVEFRKVFLDPHEIRMANLLAKLPDSIPDGSVALYVNHFVKRIHLLKERLAGKELSSFLMEKGAGEKHLPFYDLPLRGTQQGPSADARERFVSLYLSYQIWRSDEELMRKEISGLQSSLDRLLSVKGGQLRWLIAYANDQDLPAITLGDFWKGASPKAGEPAISPAFTREGRKVIDAFIQEAKFGEQAAFAGRKEEFDKYYQKECSQAWSHFTNNFSRGMERIRGQKDWQKMADKMGTEQGPHFEFLSRLEKELGPILGMENLPRWVRQVYQLRLGQSAAAARQAAPAAPGTAAKAADEIKKLFTAEKRDALQEGKEKMESFLEAAKAYQEYRQALNGLASVAASRSQAFEQAARVFGEDPATSKAPLYVAYGALTKMKESLGGTTRGGDETLATFLSGPLKFYESYMRLEAGCHLQGQWDSTVLSEVKAYQDLQAVQLLLSPDGPVEKFLKGPAAPFLIRSADRGYYAKKAFGENIPFSSSFFSFLQQRESSKAVMMKSSYLVPIRGFPGEANPGARALPQRTVLQLNCGGNAQSLEIFSYPKGPQNFQWSPQSCGDATFQIDVGELALKKRYSGPNAFPEFLQDFQGGMRTFYPRDFPGEKAALERMGIQYLRVRYEIGGDQAAVRKFSGAPQQAPRTIAACWE